jgi:hypothetical protein
MDEKTKITLEKIRHKSIKELFDEHDKEKREEIK